MVRKTYIVDLESIILIILDHKIIIVKENQW